jgi:hypothetical protein
LKTTARFRADVILARRIVAPSLTSWPGASPRFSVIDEVLKGFSGTNSYFALFFGSIDETYTNPVPKGGAAYVQASPNYL